MDSVIQISHLRSEHETDAITETQRWSSFDRLIKRDREVMHTSNEKRCHWPCYLVFKKKRN